MNIGIVSSSSFDIYAAAIISRLAQLGLKPRCVLCVHRSRFRQLGDYFQRHGIGGTAEKVLQVCGLKPWPGSGHWGVMAHYAAEHQLEGWRDSLPTICQRLDIPLLRIEGLNDDQTVRYVREKGLDVLLNAGRDIYRSAIIGASRQGVLNVHKGRLPSYRGYHVVEWSVLQGDAPCVTLHRVDTGVDTGDILRVEPIPATPGDTIDTLRAKSYPLQVELMVWGVQQLANHTIAATRQRRADGRQYFLMHPRLRALAETRLATQTAPPEVTSLDDLAADKRNAA